NSVACTLLYVHIEWNCHWSCLRFAFQTVGYLPEPGEKFSFTEARNPVMALAVYLADLVEFDVANASARSSQNNLYDESSVVQLPARHCLILEDSTGVGALLLPLKH
ncbi:hypothetical protein MKW94_004916, partial [Papaver nudicaule]|nr:hypothetical protein [Papaver nudicaule]